MNATAVVGPLKLVKRAPEVGFVPDQRAVQQLGPECLDPAPLGKSSSQVKEPARQTAELITE
jgi:hypothetical protein